MTESDRPDAPAPVVGRQTPLTRLPQLDGLRAVAVAMVVMAHIGFLVTMPLTARKALSPVLAGDGVELFFILSGYLITSILLRERTRTGGISLRRFYARRALRIMPAFYAFLIVVAVLAAAGHAAVSKSDLALCAVYLWDYVPRVVPWIQHCWSLAIEEQFYLLWPLTLGRLRPRTALWVAVVGIAISPFIRLATWNLHGIRSPGMSLHTRADALLIGCAIALLPVAYPDLYPRIREAVLRWRLDLAGTAIYVLVLPYVISEYVDTAVPARVSFSFGLTLEVLAGGLALFGLLERPASRLSRGLASPVPRHLGVVSYSIYLWQEPFVISSVQLPMAVRVLGLLATAEVSFWLVERPFLARKGRFASPGHPTDRVASAA